MPLESNLIPAESSLIPEHYCLHDEANGYFLGYANSVTSLCGQVTYTRPPPSINQSRFRWTSSSLTVMCDACTFIKKLVVP